MAPTKNKKRPAAVSRATSRKNWLVWGGAAALVAVIAAAAYFAFADGDGGSSVRRGSVRRPTPVVVTEMVTTVKVENTDYFPAALRIPVGGTVRWEFLDRTPHNVTEDRGRFESDNLRDGAEYEFTFDTAGEYFYYCTLHHKMQATVLVGDVPETGVTP